MFLHVAIHRYLRAECFTARSANVVRIVRVHLRDVHLQCMVTGQDLLADWARFLDVQRFVRPQQIPLREASAAGVTFVRSILFAAMAFGEMQGQIAARFVRFLTNFTPNFPPMVFYMLQDGVAIEELFVAAAHVTASAVLALVVRQQLREVTLPNGTDFALERVEFFDLLVRHSIGLPPYADLLLRRWRVSSVQFTPWHSF
uniref:Uncharacterized protein n=1 Tax=Anopheles albimanus TaxID=7167 RepID=A0A182FXW5_ANOAL